MWKAVCLKSLLTSLESLGITLKNAPHIWHVNLVQLGSLIPKKKKIHSALASKVMGAKLFNLAQKRADLPIHIQVVGTWSQANTITVIRRYLCLEAAKSISVRERLYH